MKLEGRVEKKKKRASRKMKKEKEELENLLLTKRQRLDDAIQSEPIFPSL